MHILREADAGRVSGVRRQYHAPLSDLPATEASVAAYTLHT